MRRTRTIAMALLTILILFAILFVLSGIQQSMFHLFWNIFQLKYLIWLTIGLIVGFGGGYLYAKLGK